jgi:phosphoribosylglycinamide formyltransferase-1
MRIAVFVSGGGTNLQAIIDRIEDGRLTGVQIVKVIASKEGVFAIERAKKHNIPFAIITKKNFKEQREYDQALIESLENDNIDLVVLAGFLSLLGSDFIGRYKNRIINVHPALIPSFCGEGMYGIKPHMAAIERGVKLTGATVHFVDDCYDSGPIILQKSVPIEDDDTPQTLQERVMIQAEQVILPEAIQLLADGKIIISGNRTLIKNESI